MLTEEELKNFPDKVFISGIDTDAGKSVVTGLIARTLNETGKNTTTLKLIQTGNKDFSEDIELHRKIMGLSLTDEDKQGVTAPEIFSYPCSPDLASRLDGREINFDRILRSIDSLSAAYDTVLIEGAGGLMVPLKEQYLTIDFIKEHEWPLILVTNGALGSINHTLLSLFAVRKYGIPLYAVAYNRYFDKDKIIGEDTRNYIKKWIEGHFKETKFIEMPAIEF